MTKRLDWEQVGLETTGNCPPLISWQCVIGKSKAGTNWLCRVVPNRNKKGGYYVQFDKEDYTGGDPFLRDEVVNARNYWEMRRVVYHERLVSYEEVQDVINDFMRAYNIEMG